MSKVFSQRNEPNHKPQVLICWQKHAQFPRKMRYEMILLRFIQKDHSI